jgi:hypothetical protein
MNNSWWSSIPDDGFSFFDDSRPGRFFSFIGFGARMQPPVAAW